MKLRSKHLVRAASAVAALAAAVGLALSQAAPALPAPDTLTLEQAVERATANEPAFAAALAESKAAQLDRKMARTALLPTSTYHNQAVYTQANGVPASRIGQVTDAPSPVFIANNAVREYSSQGVFDERIGLGQLVAIRAADASAMRLEAELEIARRGLVATVVSLYDGVGAEGGKVRIAREALDEANRFLDLTEKREVAREAAHADVLKAQLLQQGRARVLRDAEAAADKARLELGVLLYPDPATPFTLAPDAAPAPLPELAAVAALAAQNNPELRRALAVVASSKADTAAARTALLPELALNVTYGIDATNFGVNGPDGIRNLGYAMSAGLDIPVWDWLATERKVKQARLRETAARTALTAAQRRQVANLQEFYAEARVAEEQLASLSASVGIARESLRLTYLRYVDGESTALEVVDAATALSSAEDGEVDGQTRYRLALAALETLTGRLP